MQMLAHFMIYTVLTGAYIGTVLGYI